MWMTGREGGAARRAAPDAAGSGLPGDHPGEAVGDTVVIGAGIVGLCVAWYLLREGGARDGATVTVLDPAAPGSGTSSGNAGAISQGSVAPLAMPGVLKQVPRMLLDPAGALRVPPAYWPRALPWLARFVSAARPERVAAIAEALSRLLAHAPERHREIAAAEGASHLLEDNGQLYAYRDESQLTKDMTGWELRRRHGQHWQRLDSAELHELEPAVSPDYAIGILVPEQGLCVNPWRHAQMVADGVQRAGGVFLRRRATAIATEGGRVVGVETDAGRVPAARVVIAAGAWSAPLLRPLGYRVPLESQRGYHVDLHAPGIRPRRPVVAADRKVFVSPMDFGVRVAGTVEFGGLQRPADPQRAALLLRDLAALFPGMRTEPAGEPWMGHRPCLPDSLPVLGPVARWPGLWTAFGHGHLGLTGSAPTGALLAQAMLGRRPNFDFSPFAPERF
ncbi:FAD-dependent oxidoreductase [Roseomonas sp. NAR14]|uniref:FAD-dependent oxidoreductase n=1 Tax=Roseomonas acroporae TaxID=2937791 RepID=A0A9X1YCW7_9PROT|nr:FAD-dependent oxidoreductase [Roseomonas acroporae]MCK8786392.1 FAD-dependent oxidoreductase [Roseomonas acroporae]